MVLLGTAAGLVLSVLGPIARDLTPLATLAVSLMMYITPVIYLQSTIQSPVVRKLIEWNPITYLVDVPRSMICLGRSDNLHAFLWLTCGAVALVTIGLRVFYLLEDLVAERL
jgi:lipopolysaccharide transport system permease protein